MRRRAALLLMTMVLLLMVVAPVSTSASCLAATTVSNTATSTTSTTSTTARRAATVGSWRAYSARPTASRLGEVACRVRRQPPLRDCVHTQRETERMHTVQSPRRHVWWAGVGR